MVPEYPNIARPAGQRSCFNVRIFDRPLIYLSNAPGIFNYVQESPERGHEWCEGAVAEEVGKEEAMDGGFQFKITFPSGRVLECKTALQTSRLSWVTKVCHVLCVMCVTQVCHVWFVTKVCHVFVLCVVCVVFHLSFV